MAMRAAAARGRRAPGPAPAMRAGQAAAAAAARRAAGRASVIAAAKMTQEEAGEMLELAQMDAEERMTKAIDNVVSNYATVRTGRASVSILDRVKVVRPARRARRAAGPRARTAPPARARTDAVAVDV